MGIWNDYSDDQFNYAKIPFMTMKLPYMLNQMCHIVLSLADIGAIRKARGFKENEVASRTTFESFFLSSIGLETVMASLTPEEVATLRLLVQQEEEVDIAFFERLYGSAKKAEGYYYGTYTQRYKDILDAVKKSLVRKGVLVMAENKARGDSVQMERWRFCFPPQFAEFLPPIIPSHHPSDASGEVHTEVARAKLLEIVGSQPVSTPPGLARFALTIEQGSLKFGNRDFLAGDLASWQQGAWLAALGVSSSKESASLSPVKAVQAILETLGPREWITPEQLEPALKVLCFGLKMPPAKKICEAGWKWGCLVRLVEGQKTYYRLPSSNENVPSPGSGLDPSAYLKPHPLGNSAMVDLRLIPFDALAQLNRLARLEVIHYNLIVSPDLIKLGRSAPEERQSPLANWLYTHFPAFQQSFDVVNVQWGKTIMHSGLLVARVCDLSLRVQLERDLGEYLVVLDDKFVAFPRAWRAEVEKTLKKGGFVIKEVRA